MKYKKIVTKDQDRN